MPGTELPAVCSTGWSGRRRRCLKGGRSWHPLPVQRLVSQPMGQTLPAVPAPPAHRDELSRSSASIARAFPVSVIDKHFCHFLGNYDSTLSTVVHTLRVSLRSVRASPVLSTAMDCWAREMLADLIVVSVAFLAGANLRPTLYLALLKSIPTPGFLRLPFLTMAVKRVRTQKFAPATVSAVQLHHHIFSRQPRHCSLKFILTYV